MTHPATLFKAAAGLCLLVALAGRAEASPESPAAPGFSEVEGTAPEALEPPQVARGASPRFVYASGFQGAGYYANPGTVTSARQAQAPTSSGNRGQSVGPGVRDWSTGRRGRLHKPWLQPR